MLLILVLAAAGTLVPAIGLTLAEARLSAARNARSRS